MKTKPVASKKSVSRTSKSAGANLLAIESSKEVADALRYGRILFEKCELGESKEAYLKAMGLAEKISDLRSTMEAIAGLLRLAGEALDQDAIKEWDAKLDQMMEMYPDQVPAMAFLCKYSIARRLGNNKLAQRNAHRFLKATESQPETPENKKEREEEIVRAWAMIAPTLLDRGFVKRAKWLAETILSRYESNAIRGVNGALFILLGRVAENGRHFDVAEKWYQKSHAAFLQEHNWYSHLYVLLNYAKLERLKQNYAGAYWYLNLIDKAAHGNSFGIIRKLMENEKRLLEQDAVDLLIDAKKGVVKTRENSQISLRKQWVLLSILDALSTAHSDPRSGEEGKGLSKSEIIEKVWREQYRPEAHDNKLYYNINRLRKLIEPDMKKPRYLLNWREGYRLAPGLRVHRIGGKSVSHGGREKL